MNFIADEIFNSSFENVVMFCRKDIFNLLEKMNDQTLKDPL